MNTNKTNIVKKYTEEELTKLQVKLNGGSYSDSWLKKHFRQLIEYARWVNGESVVGSK